MTQPSADLLDHGTDVALLRPPVAAPAIEMTAVRSEERLFALPAGHPLAGRGALTLADVKMPSPASGMCRLTHPKTLLAAPSSPRPVASAADGVFLVPHGTRRLVVGDCLPRYWRAGPSSCPARQ